MLALAIPDDGMKGEPGPLIPPKHTIDMNQNPVLDNFFSVKNSVRAQFEKKGRNTKGKSPDGSWSRSWGGSRQSYKKLLAC